MFCISNSLFTENLFMAAEYNQFMIIRNLSGACSRVSSFFFCKLLNFGFLDLFIIFDYLSLQEKVFQPFLCTFLILGTKLWQNWGRKEKGKNVICLPTALAELTRQMCDTVDPYTDLTVGKYHIYTPVY